MRVIMTDLVEEKSLSQKFRRSMEQFSKGSHSARIPAKISTYEKKLLLKFIVELGGTLQRMGGAWKEVTGGLLYSSNNKEDLTGKKNKP